MLLLNSTISPPAAYDLPLGSLALSSENKGREIHIAPACAEREREKNILSVIEKSFQPWKWLTTHRKMQQSKGQDRLNAYDTDFNIKVYLLPRSDITSHAWCAQTPNSLLYNFVGKKTSVTSSCESGIEIMLQSCHFLLWWATSNVCMCNTSEWTRAMKTARFEI